MTTKTTKTAKQVEQAEVVQKAKHAVDDFAEGTNHMFVKSLAASLSSTKTEASHAEAKAMEVKPADKDVSQSMEGLKQSAAAQKTMQAMDEMMAKAKQ